MLSLDPRVNRLPPIQQENATRSVEHQLQPFEVFVKAKEGKPFQHEGNVRASDLELAFVLAKEIFTRRFTCYSLCVAATKSIWVSETTEQNQTVYGTFPEETPINDNQVEKYVIYHLVKRGKQHIHVENIEATSLTHAKSVARALFGQTIALNVWIIPYNAIRFTTPEEEDLWSTLPDKKYRDAIDYKGSDLLNRYLTNKNQ